MSTQKPFQRNPFRRTRHTRYHAQSYWDCYMFYHNIKLTMRQNHRISANQKPATSRLPKKCSMIPFEML